MEATNKTTTIEGSGGTNYQQRLERVRKYVVSQGIPLDSPRARRYAESQGVSPDDLGLEIVDQPIPDMATQTFEKYAKSLGLEMDDHNVQKYATAGIENEPIDEVDIDSEVDNERFKAAVLHYAESQDLPVDDPRIIKYARGLLKPTGDFSVERKAERLDREVIESRIRASVQRYADSMGLPVDDPQVLKYENGQRKGPYRTLLESAI